MTWTERSLVSGITRLESAMEAIRSASVELDGLSEVPDAGAQCTKLTEEIDSILSSLYGAVHSYTISPRDESDLKRKLRNAIESAGGIYNAVNEICQKDESNKCGIEFDLENVAGWEDEDDEFSMEEYKGGYEIVGDRAVLWGAAGGDWEKPIAIIVYQDEKDNLRIYVPREGNAFNKEKNSAFGNNDDDEEPYHFDKDKMREEFSKNVLK